MREREHACVQLTDITASKCHNINDACPQEVQKHKYLIGCAELYKISAVQ